MGLSLITDMSNNNSKATTIYRKDKVSSAGNPYSTFSTKVSAKNDNDEWQSAFIELKFKKADQDKITNKCEIVIKSSFPVLNSYNERTTIQWVVMDFDVVKEGEQPTQPSDGKLDADFVSVADDVDSDELPFS